MSDADQQVAEVGKALSHPLRVAIVRELRGSSKPISPIEFSKRHDIPIGNVSYHVKALRQAGVAKVVKREPRRGAMENFHSLDGPNRLALLSALDGIDGCSH